MAVKYNLKKNPPKSVRRQGVPHIGVLSLRGRNAQRLYVGIESKLYELLTMMTIA